MDNHNEANTRKDLIDPALNKADWDVHNSAQVGIEIPADGFDLQKWKELEAQLRASENIPNVQLPSGICDYVLYRENGEIIAVVEAKRSSFDPKLAQAQTEFYVKEIEKQQGWRPFAFMTNGYDTYFLDVGISNKRLVAGFFSPDDLENILFLRNNKTPLTQAHISTYIAGRPYQQEAIRRLCETFEQGKRM